MLTINVWLYPAVIKLCSCGVHLLVLAFIGKTISKAPVLSGQLLDLYKLYTSVQRHKGFVNVSNLCVCMYMYVSVYLSACVYVCMYVYLFACI